MGISRSLVLPVYLIMSLSADQADLTAVMPSAVSIHREINLTHYGLYPLWLGLDLSHPAGDGSHTTPPRSKSHHISTPNSDLPTPSSHGRRDTVKQTSSAWANVQRSPVQSMNTPRAPALQLSLPTQDQESQFRDAVQALNEKRTESGHIASIGTGGMPFTEKEAQRRMMVVICGEGRDKAAISEVNR